MSLLAVLRATLGCWQPPTFRAPWCPIFMASSGNAPLVSIRLTLQISDFSSSDRWAQTQRAEVIPQAAWVISSS